MSGRLRRHARLIAGSLVVILVAAVGYALRSVGSAHAQPSRPVATVGAVAPSLAPQARGAGGRGPASAAPRSRRRSARAGGGRTIRAGLPTAPPSRVGLSSSLRLVTGLSPAQVTSRAVCPQAAAGHATCAARVVVLKTNGAIVRPHVTRYPTLGHVRSRAVSGARPAAGDWSTMFATVMFLDRTRSRMPQPWRTILDWAVTIAVAVAFVLAFEAEVAKPYRIPTASMEPTLHCARPVDNCEARFSDRVVANRLAYRLRDPKRGDIVVFRSPAMANRCGVGDGGTTFVKRIVGLPGEVVSSRNGVIAIDGNRLSEPYLSPARRGSQTGAWPRVAPGHYFMLGDNRTRSCDSRIWGTVARDNLIAPVLLTYWPPNRAALH